MKIENIVEGKYQVSCAGGQAVESKKTTKRNRPCFDAEKCAVCPFVDKCPTEKSVFICVPGPARGICGSNKSDLKITPILIPFIDNHSITNHNTFKVFHKRRSTMALKNLPLGIQDFEDFRENNYIYVDKTKLIYELVKTPKGFYFLSRPRRFGKSLLISTLGCLFEAKKELFKDLWIYKHTDWQWEKHPVIKIGFNTIDHASPELLKKDILRTINICLSHRGFQIFTGKCFQ